MLQLKKNCYSNSIPQALGVERKISFTPIVILSGAQRNEEPPCTSTGVCTGLRLPKPQAPNSKSQIQRIILFFLLGLGSWFLGLGTSYAQSSPVEHRIEGPRISTEANKEFCPCLDTIKILFFKKIVDLDPMLPEWYPVINYDEITVLEGLVMSKYKGEHIGAHVSPADFPVYHYTHDVGFNVKPDQTPDNRYTNLLALRVKKKMVDGVEITDTVLNKYIHVEWESGLGANNKGNLCSNLNRQGRSCGFYSAGHRRRDVIWNWPTLGDWVHIEGLWIWDRGHPPSWTEIHPARLVAVRRNLAALINAPIGAPDNLKSQKVFATRIDIFANGDGGALNNNRRDVPSFVNKVKMSDKDYVFRVKHNLPRPSAKATLSFMVESHNGDDYSADLKITSFADGDIDLNHPFVKIEIPWKDEPDTSIFARTVYVYWNEENGIPENYKVTSYRVTLESLRFRKLKEFLSRSEFRIFLEVNGDWLFLNEFIDKEDILDKGLGKTRKRNWDIMKEFIVYVPENDTFRIYAGGWEADGINERFGWLLDPNSPCNPKTKKMIHKKLSVLSPFALRGCQDDRIGEVHAFHTTGNLDEGGVFEVSSDGKRIKDNCPGNNGIQKDVFRLKYRIEKISDYPKH